MKITIDNPEDTKNFIQTMKGWRTVFQIRKVLANKKSHHEQIKRIKELVR
jgi:hypothetical protein